MEGSQGLQDSPHVLGAQTYETWQHKVEEGVEFAVPPVACMGGVGENAGKDESMQKNWSVPELVGASIDTVSASSIFI